MALTTEDKSYLETTFATKVELTGLENRLGGLEGMFKEDILRLELLMEHSFDELRGMFGDVLGRVKEVPAHRERLDGHDTAIGRLNRTVYGYDPNQQRPG